MTSPSTDATVRAVVIGAGQSGLATGFYLRRYGLEPGVDFVILDAADRPGGAWRACVSSPRPAPPPSPDGPCRRGTTPRRDTHPPAMSWTTSPGTRSGTT